MKYTIGFFVLMLVVVMMLGNFMPKVYEVRYDFANGEVVEIRNEKGNKVNETLETLRAKGIMYEKVYVQPRTMGN